MFRMSLNIQNEIIQFYTELSELIRNYPYFTAKKKVNIRTEA